MQEFMFKYEPKDYTNYSREVLGIRRIFINMLKLYAIPYIILSLVFSLCFVSSLFGGIIWWYWLFYIVMFISFIIILSCLYLLAITLQFLFGGSAIKRMQQGVNKNIKIIMSNETIIIDNGDMHAEHKFSSIKDIYNKKNNYLLFISDFQAIIVPKRIFKTQEEATDCWDYIENNFKNANNKKVNN